MHNFLSWLRPWYWRITILSAATMWVQAIKHPNQDSTMLEIAFWIVTGCLSISSLLWVDQVWCWVQHECAIQLILNNRYRSGHQIVLPNLVDAYRPLTPVQIAWLVITLAGGIILAAVDVNIIAYMLGIGLIVSTLFLLAVCLIYRFDRYRKRDLLIVDIDTAVRMAQGESFSDQTVQLHSPNDLKKPHSYLMSL